MLSPCSPPSTLSTQQPFSGASTATQSPILSPKKATKLVLLHLPFGLHSKVEVLHKRRIQPSLCHVSDSSNPKTERLDLTEEMEVIANRLANKELWVHSEYLDTVNRIEHTFQSRFGQRLKSSWRIGRSMLR
ncbi:unnamed protein product, partial [Mesorhabditis spiculigera]